MCQGRVSCHKTTNASLFSGGDINTYPQSLGLGYGRESRVGHICSPCPHMPISDIPLIVVILERCVQNVQILGFQPKVISILAFHCHCATEYTMFPSTNMTLFYNYKLVMYNIEQYCDSGVGRQTTTMFQVDTLFKRSCMIT